MVEICQFAETRLAVRTCYVDGFQVNGKTSQKLAEEAVKMG